MMNILDVVPTATTMVTFTFSPTEKHYIFFGNDYVEVQNNVKYDPNMIQICPEMV